MYHLIYNIQDKETLCKVDVSTSLPNHPEDQLLLIDSLYAKEIQTTCQDCLNVVGRMARTGFKLMLKSVARECKRRVEADNKLKEIQEDYRRNKI